MLVYLLLLGIVKKNMIASNENTCYKMCKVFDDSCYNWSSITNICKIRTIQSIYIRNNYIAC